MTTYTNRIFTAFVVPPASLRHLSFFNCFNKNKLDNIQILLKLTVSFRSRNISEEE